MPRALLISLRDPDDPMARHEHRCFAERSALDPSHLAIHFMAHGDPDREFLLSQDAVFFGGSGAYSVLDDVDWIRRGLDALVLTVELKVPAWASCFGFQGLAVALGGEVIRDDAQTEMGSTLLRLTEAGRRDPLLGLLPERFWAQEGHHDRVSRIPDGVELLATGDVCYAQAFKVQSAPFWASQFHPELTVACTVDRFRHYGAHYFDGDAEALLAQLSAGAETPEVGSLLANLVRHRF